MIRIVLPWIPRRAAKSDFFAKARESAYPCLYLPEWVVSYLYLYISNPQRRLASNDLGASGELVSGKSLSSCHNFPAWPLLFVLPTREVQLQSIVQFAHQFHTKLLYYCCSSLITQVEQVENNVHGNQHASRVQNEVRNIVQFALCSALPWWAVLK